MSKRICENDGFSKKKKIQTGSSYDKKKWIVRLSLHISDLLINKRDRLEDVSRNLYNLQSLSLFSRKYIIVLS